MTKDKPVGAKAIAIAIRALALADRVIRQVEIETIAKITNSTVTTIAQDMITRRASNAENILPTLQALHPDAKQRFIKTLWLVALVDHDLHEAEEKLIYEISDLIGLSRKELVKAGQDVAQALGPEVK
jgi:uncharacterized tellurite resistance protein B-like protein